MSRYIPVLETFESGEHFPSPYDDTLHICNGRIMADNEFIHELPDCSYESWGFDGGNHADMD